MSVGQGDRKGFVPPPYPYDLLDEARAAAAALPGGVVDLSIGTPGDPVGTRILGDPIADPVTGPVSQARITIPDGVRPAEVWLLAATGPGRQALIGFREGG